MSSLDFLVGKMAYINPVHGVRNAQARVLVRITDVTQDHNGEDISVSLGMVDDAHWWRYPGQLELVPEEEQAAALSLFELARESV